MGRGAVAAELPHDENERLAELADLEILDTPAEAEFDAVVRLAAQICGVPIALISLVDGRRQWFKARVGLEVDETPRDVSFCAHAILGETLMEVSDTSLDPRFRDNPLRASEPHVEFYAGAPLRTANGRNLGTLCVIDHVPRTLTIEQREGLETLADQVVRLFETRRAVRLHRETVAALQSVDAELRDGTAVVTSSPPRLMRAAAFALIALLVAATLAATRSVHASIEVGERSRLARALHRAERFLDARGRGYASVLGGAAALFQASDYVSADGFAAYVGSLRLDRNYPGLLGIGYVQGIGHAQRAAFESAARAEDPSFVLHPDVPGDAHVVVRFLEPRRRNAAAIGLDWTSDPERFRAAAAAAARRDVTLSRPVHLLQAPREGPGFLLLLPLAYPMPIAPAEAERSANPSFVYAVIHARDLVTGIARAAGTDLELAVLDTESPDASLLGDPRALMQHPLATSGRVEIGGRGLVLIVAPGRRFASIAERSEPWTILVLGLSGTLLTAGLLWSLARTQARSQVLAARMTAALRRNERTLRDVVDGTADFIVAVDENGHLDFTNLALRETLSVAEHTTTTMSVLDIVHPDARAGFAELLESIRLGHEPPHRVDTAFIARGGVRIDVEGVLSVLRDEGTITTRGIFRDVTARKAAETALLAANAELARLAANDGLTGVANRRTFDSRLAEEWARAHRTGAPLSVVLLDVDHFKQFNDRYGHPAGDECLKRVGECVKNACRRAGELGARYGGEEFVLLLPGSSEVDAAKVAELLRSTIQALRIPHDAQPHGVVTASFGVASLESGPVAAAAELVAAADRALYRAKGSGRNSIELALPADDRT